MAACKIHGFATGQTINWLTVTYWDAQQIREPDRVETDIDAFIDRALCSKIAPFRERIA